MPVGTRTCHLHQAVCRSFLPACLPVAATLALVQVLAGSSGSHVGGGLRNSRNVSQLLTTLDSLPVTCPCDFLQNWRKRSVVGGQQHPDSISKDFWAPAVVLRSNMVCVWGGAQLKASGHRWLSITSPPPQSSSDQ